MRRRVALAVVAVAALAFAVGSGGFSSVTADRTTSVHVVGDEDAYMALEYPDEPVTLSGGEQYDDAFVTVRNQFTETVNFTVEYDVSTSEGLRASPARDTVSNPSVGVGKKRDVSVQFECQSSGDHEATVTFSAQADGSDVSAETTEPRTVEYDIGCSSATDTATTEQTTAGA
ncbi:hypothetical protein [Haloarcula amylovorans]|uniref:hypothetical protein n=1 Tax=Haloarcula amylovorans TaxID=2562280 RepID=UPI00107638AF|nr:hypothetical protein [Halomicroarcula amylolytica]